MERGRTEEPIIAMDMGPCFNCSQVEDGDMQGHDLTHDAVENEVECCANCQRDAGWNGLEPSSSMGLGHFLILLLCSTHHPRRMILFCNSRFTAKVFKSSLKKPCLLHSAINLEHVGHISSLQAVQPLSILVLGSTVG